MSTTLPFASSSSSTKALLPSADLLTPPSSPSSSAGNGFKRQNAFAQWAVPPLSPTLTIASDEESDVGFPSTPGGPSSSAAAYSRSPSPTSLPTTPKGHPLENSKSLLWGHHFSNHVRSVSQQGAAAVGLGLGLEQTDDLSEDRFEVRERERRAGKPARLTPSLTEQPRTWPKIRIARRSRPALYAVACIFTLLFYVLSHRPSTAASTPSTLTRSRMQLDSRSASRGGSTSTAIVARRAAQAKAVRAEQKVLSQPVGKRWIWASRAEELAALMSYIISAEANHIPAVDASVPLDPSLLLDFDPYSRQASSHLIELQRDLWADYPVVLLAKQRNPHTRFIKHELEQLYLDPKPFIIDTDARADTEILTGLLERLVDSSELPMLFVGGKVVGGWAEVDKLVKGDAFKPLLASAGAASVPPKKKKSKKAGHGGKTEEQLAAALEAEKRADEAKRLAQQEVERLERLAGELPEEIPVEDAEDKEYYAPVE